MEKQKNKKQKIDKFKNFEIVTSGFMGGAPVPGGGSSTCKDGAVWCKVGDNCRDRLCYSFCPTASCRHDGCCTSSWDSGGDTAE